MDSETERTGTGLPLGCHTCLRVVQGAGGNKQGRDCYILCASVSSLWSPQGMVRVSDECPLGPHKADEGSQHRQTHLGRLVFLCFSIIPSF